MFRQDPRIQPSVREKDPGILPKELEKDPEILPNEPKQDRRFLKNMEDTPGMLSLFFSISTSDELKTYPVCYRYVT